MESVRTWKVYGLTDPRRNDAIRYVGVTCQDVNARVYGHFNRQNMLEESHTHKTKWISAVLSEGLKPGVVILETCGDNWADRERAWIATLPNLTNATEGGDGTIGYRHTQEAKDKVSKANKGRKHTEETRAKLRAAHSIPGRIYPPRPQQVKPKKPKGPHATIGRKYSAERIANMRAGMIGKKKSVEGCKNIREASRARIANGYTVSAETRAKTSRAMKGRVWGPYSVERREKARAGLLAYLAKKNNGSE